jgi:excisionase family DNA binding protein
MTYQCNRCGEQVTYTPDWPACTCDLQAGLSLTVRETAAYICVSQSKIRDMITRGDVIINQSRRRARIPVTSIKAFLTRENRAWRLREGIYRNR